MYELLRTFTFTCTGQAKLLGFYPDNQSIPELLTSFTCFNVDLELRPSAPSAPSPLGKEDLKNRHFKAVMVLSEIHGKTVVVLGLPSPQKIAITGSKYRLMAKTKSTVA